MDTKMKLEERALEEKLIEEIDSEKKFMTFKKLFKILELNALLAK